MRKTLFGTMLVCFGTLLACEAGTPDLLMPGDGASKQPPGSAVPPDTGVNPPPTGPSMFSVHLVDGPLDRLSEVNVEVLKVVLLDGQGIASELGAPMKVLNLLKLRDGISETLATAHPSAGSYVGLRLLLGSNNSVRLADGSVHPLKVPSGQQSGIKLSLDLVIAEGDSQDLFIDFDVAESIHIVSAGRNDQYILRPVLRAIEKRASGAINGRLTVAGQDKPLAGATIYAESRDPQGQPQIVRRAQTGADGSYQLNLLPLDAAYHVVVSRTSINGVTYRGMAGTEIKLDREHSTATLDMTAAPAVSVGSLQVQVSPMAGEQAGDTCMVLQGAKDHLLIVASDVTSRETAEQVQFDGLPVDTYVARCMRRTTEASGTTTLTTSQAAEATLTAAETAILQLSF